MRKAFLIITVIIALVAIGYCVFWHYDHKPIDKLAVFLNMDEGKFSIMAVVQKQNTSGKRYSNRLECLYSSEANKPAVIDTLYDDLWSYRVLEMGTVFFGIISKWDYYPKTSYGVQLPEELQGVYYSNRLGKPAYQGYMPEIQLKITERLTLWYVIHDRKLYLLEDNQVVDRMDVSKETEALLNASWCDEAATFFNKYK